MKVIEGVYAIECCLSMSKTNAEGMKDKRLTCFQNSETPALCPVRLAKKFLDKILPGEECGAGEFGPFYSSRQLKSTTPRRISKVQMIAKWKDAAKALNLPTDFTGHSVRRSVITNLRSQGCSVSQVTAWVGYAENSKMVEEYDEKAKFRRPEIPEEKITNVARNQS